jgi:ATP-dependent 26S proteasome regulatory subunit
LGTGIIFFLFALCAGKFVVDIDKNIDINDVTPNCRVALRNDSYTLHKILPNKVDPLVSLMMVEKVPDSTYEMVGGLDKQIKEIKEVILKQLTVSTGFFCNQGFGSA